MTGGDEKDDDVLTAMPSSGHPTKRAGLEWWSARPAVQPEFNPAGCASETGLASEVSDALGGLSYSGTPAVSDNISATQLGLHRPGT